MLEHFFAILAPSDCLACHNEGSLLCIWCREEALPGVMPRCYQCNALSADSRTCQKCRRKTPVRHLWVRTEYSDSARQLVHKMKISYSGEAADIIAAELVSLLPFLSPNTLVVPVPTASTRVRMRGYDHAARIARKVAADSGLLFVPALHRTGQVRQVGAKRSVRLQQMQNEFRINPYAAVAGAHIVLVDDVVTTGSTIEAATRTLKAAGAKKIDVLAFARAR